MSRSLWALVTDALATLTAGAFSKILPNAWSSPWLESMWMICSNASPGLMSCASNGMPIWASEDEIDETAFWMADCCSRMSLGTSCGLS